MFFNNLGKKFERYSSRSDLSPRQVLRHFIIDEEDATGPGSDIHKVMDIVKEYSRRYAERDELQIYFTALLGRKGIGHLSAFYIDRVGTLEKWRLSTVMGTFDRENQRLLRYMRFEKTSAGLIHCAPIYDDGQDMHERPNSFSGSQWQISEA